MPALRQGSLALVWLGLSGTVQAQGNSTNAAAAAANEAQSLVLDAREAARRRDKPKLSAAIAALQAEQHPLTSWADYWDLSGRLNLATVDEVEAFYRRWPASYVEDRLRNDWLRELGKRRDFANFARDYPRFRMDDDREVRCWWLLTEHLAGKDVAAKAREAWYAQREADDGCQMLASALVEAGRLNADDAWQKARLSLELNRPAATRAAVALVGPRPLKDLAEALDNPLRIVKRGRALGHDQSELQLLALMRLSSQSPETVAPLLEMASLTRDHAAWAWAYLGRQAGFKQLPEAGAHYEKAVGLLNSQADRAAMQWSDDTLAWGVRSALRSLPPARRWPLVLRLTQAMSAEARQDPAWAYWQAKALLATARIGAAGDAQRSQAQEQLTRLAGPLGFYNLLAAEQLGQAVVWPEPPAPLSEAERQANAAHPGLQRAQALMALGLRGEGRREWNFSLIGMDDRQVLAAARLACNLADWQLCINTAERSRGLVDLSLRYPMPHLADIRSATEQTGLELALVLGLIRQETRFMPQLRSHAGASGLMQVMPATGKIVAKKLGLSCCDAGQLNDPQLNLRLGTTYLRAALDEFGGSQAMAAAAYNAGPGRPRRWREGATVDAAAWAEGIPFNETRDYVKLVLSNAAVYSALLNNQAPTLRARLGENIGPRPASASTAADAPALSD